MSYMGNVNDVAQLGSYGLIGVMLALIFLTGSVVWILYKIVTNHVHHNTEAAMGVIKTLEKLSTLIETKL